MRAVFIVSGITLAALPMQAASACVPPPLGYVHPTEKQLLETFVSNATDIVYGIVRHSGALGKPSRFEIFHVYRGNRSKGEVIEAPAGWDHPTPHCAAMMVPPHSKPVGTYGVIAFRAGSPLIQFIRPADVQTMIKEGWIKSAQAR